MVDFERDLTSKELIWYRHAMGLTQQEMADKLGVKRQTIWNLEHGNKNISKIYSIDYQVFYEYLVPENERLLREGIADLGVNYRDAPDELIKYVKSKIKGD